LREWRDRREKQRERRFDTEESVPRTVRRRPSTPEELTNSILYINFRRKRLIEERRLYPVGEREWRLRVRK